MSLPALIVALVAAQAADGGVFVATRASLEVGGQVVTFGPLPDGGVALVALTPAKAMALADERQAKDYELARLRQAPPATWIAVVGQLVSTALNAVPLVVALTRAP